MCRTCNRPCANRVLFVSALRFGASSSEDRDLAGTSSGNVVFISIRVLPISIGASRKQGLPKLTEFARSHAQFFNVSAYTARRKTATHVILGCRAHPRITTLGDAALSFVAAEIQTTPLLESGEARGTSTPMLRKKNENKKEREEKNGKT